MSSVDAGRSMSLDERLSAWAMSPRSSDSRSRTFVRRATSRTSVRKWMSRLSTMSTPIGLAAVEAGGAHREGAAVDEGGGAEPKPAGGLEPFLPQEEERPRHQVGLDRDQLLVRVG